MPEHDVQLDAPPEPALDILSPGGAHIAAPAAMYVFSTAWLITRGRRRAWSTEHGVGRAHS